MNKILLIIGLLVLSFVFLSGCNTHSQVEDKVACANKGLGFWSSSYNNNVNCYNITSKTIISIDYRCLDYNDKAINCGCN